MSGQWQVVERIAQDESDISLRHLFASDPARGQKFSLSCNDIFFDFSKQILSVSGLDALVALAHEAGVQEHFAGMMNGAELNVTEHRPVGHMHLRSQGDSSMAAAAKEQTERAIELAEAIRAGRIVGFSGHAFRAIVSIGIGGSDLGNVVVADALEAWCNGPACYFVSSIDPTHLDNVLTRNNLSPEFTLFVVASKTFTTSETLHIASRAREWITSALGAEAVSHHFVATTAAPKVAAKWGISNDHILEFFDWVGGRFSVSSVIGFPAIVSCGGEVFRQFLRGMAATDEYVQTTPLAQNAPVIHALLGVWNASMRHSSSLAVIPYSHGLRHFPAFLQQLLTESNGKSVTVDGHGVTYATSPTVWGEPGPAAQHSFFQMLHQGTNKISTDFIAVRRTSNNDESGQQILFASMLAQSAALAFGKTEQEVRADGVPESLVPHRTFVGNKPSTCIVMPVLNAFTLGQLIAFYEHSAAVQGWIWNINSFDQWGVELGKALTAQIEPILTGKQSIDTDSSTAMLADWYRQQD
ncbi:MAG: glucose-6-phosphate isomerase [Ilumatobacteraceae bacterium]|nr:glucose-6-phosphate isomerase [Ilumatobacteraceae bacterium]